MRCRLDISGSRQRRLATDEAARPAKAPGLWPHSLRCSAKRFISARRSRNQKSDSKLTRLWSSGTTANSIRHRSIHSSRRSAKRKERCNDHSKHRNLRGDQSAHESLSRPRPFEFDESHLFFGRDGQSEQLIGKLSRTRFLAVVGTSGSGKSSLVRAGLLPALLGGFMTSAGSDWRIAIMRPGNDPISKLARAMNSPDVFGSEDRREHSAFKSPSPKPLCGAAVWAWSKPCARARCPTTKTCSSSWINSRSCFALRARHHAKRKTRANATRTTRRPSSSCCSKPTVSAKSTSTSC